jgi:hypothetical protein
VLESDWGEGIGDGDGRERRSFAIFRSNKAYTPTHLPKGMVRPSGAIESSPGLKRLQKDDGYGGLRSSGLSGAPVRYVT